MGGLLALCLLWVALDGRDAGEVRGAAGSGWAAPAGEAREDPVRGVPAPEGTESRGDARRAADANGGGAFDQGQAAGGGSGFLRLLGSDGQPLSDGRLALLGPVSSDSIGPWLEREVLQTWEAGEEGWLPEPLGVEWSWSQLHVDAPGYLGRRFTRRPADRTVQLPAAQRFAGRVLEHGSDRPLAGVWLVLGRSLLSGERYHAAQRTVSDSDGRFSFESAPRGAQLGLHIPVGSSTGVDVTLQLSGDVEEGYEVLLLPPDRARLRFVDARDGTPFAHTDVGVEPLGWLRTDAAGEVDVRLFADRPEERDLIEPNFKVWGAETLVTHVSPRVGQEVTVVPLLRGTELLVRVLTEDGTPVEGGTLMPRGVAQSPAIGDLELPGTSISPWGPLERTDEPGLWRWRVLGGSSLVMAFFHPEFAVGELWVETHPDESATSAELRLPMGTTIEGRLVGAPAQASVTIAALGGTGGREAAVDEDHRFRLTGLEPGSLSLFVSVQGPNGTRFGLEGEVLQVQLSPGLNRMDLEVVPLSAARTIEGVVRDTLGRPIVAADVRLSAAGSPREWGAPRQRFAWRVKSGEGGKFQFSVTHDVQWPLAVSASTAYAHTEAQLDPDDGPVDLVLPVPARVRVVVRDVSSAAPIPVPVVFLRRPDDKHFVRHAPAHLLRSGAVELEVASGPLEVRVAVVGGGFGPVELIHAVGGELHEVEHYLPSGTPLELVLHGIDPQDPKHPRNLTLIPEDPLGESGEDCQVLQFLADLLIAEIDLEGRAHFPAVAPGRYRLDPHGSAGAFTPAHLEVPAGHRPVTYVRFVR